MNLNVKQKEKKKNKFQSLAVFSQTVVTATLLGNLQNVQDLAHISFKCTRKRRQNAQIWNKVKTDSITRIQFVVKWYAIFRAWNFPPKSDKKRKKAHIIHNCTVRRITTRPVSATHQAIRKQSALNLKNTPVKPGNLGFPKLEYFAASQNKHEFVGK